MLTKVCWVIYYTVNVFLKEQFAYTSSLYKAIGWLDFAKSFFLTQQIDKYVDIKYWFELFM